MQDFDRYPSRREILSRAAGGFGAIALAGLMQENGLANDSLDVVYV